MVMPSPVQSGRVGWMKRVYVVTHPAASHHVDDLVGGWYDSHLTAKGLAEAGEIARHLRSLIPAGEVPHVVSSDLRRARQTAEAIAELFGTDAILDPGLREKSYGVGEGRPQAWFRERFVTPPAVGERMDHDEGIEGAETKRQWVNRVHAAVVRLEDDPATHRIIVTHGGSASPVIAAWMRIPAEACVYAAFRAPTGSVTVLEQDDYFHNRSLVTLGDRGFFAD